MAAFRLASETQWLPLGLRYLSPPKPTFEDTVGNYREYPAPLFQRQPDLARVQRLIAAARP